jgi:hypothetical protein
MAAVYSQVCAHRPRTRRPRQIGIRPIGVSVIVVPYYKIHTLTHIHIVPQNSHCWPLRKCASIGIAAGHTAERYLQERCVQLPSWQWRSLRPAEIDAHIVFLLNGERKINRIVWDQMSMEGVADWWPVVLPAALGQAPSDTQEQFCLAAAIYPVQKLRMLATNWNA